MWFVWLAIALALLAVAGLYLRRRLIAAAALLGLGRRGQRVLRWLIPWLLFGYPLIVFATVGVSLALGRDRMAGTEHPLATWGLVLPFFWAVLVVVQAAPYVVVLDVVARIRRRVPMTRGHAIAIVAVIGAFGVYTPARIAWERGDLDWRHHTVHVGSPTGPAGSPPFRIGFVADLQQDRFTDADRAAAIMQRLNTYDLDLVLSGGDWINMGPDHIAAAARSAGLARSRLGTFSVRGDHEHFVYVDRQRGVAEITAAMRDHGVAMLHDEVRRFEHHGRTIAVAFLTYSYPSRASRAEIERLVADIADADVSILVTHQLVAEVAELARDRVDLVLAAHTHGGQINPVLGLWHVPLARIETPYIDGRYQLGTTTIIVSAGIGYSLAPFRYAAVGSVDVVDLVW